MTRMLIVGPPGSGKGTQGERIARRLGIPAISVGDMFRAHVKEQTPQGIEAKSYIDRGDYVPDSVTNTMVRERLNEDDVVEGFLLDGYPRTLDQVRELDEILAANSVALDLVLRLDADEDELVSRLSLRAQKEGRSDDTEEVIRRRQEVFAEQTAPVIQAYRDRGLVVDVDGLGEIDEVTDRVLEAVLAHAGQTGQ